MHYLPLAVFTKSMLNVRARTSSIRYISLQSHVSLRKAATSLAKGICAASARGKDANLDMIDNDAYLENRFKIRPDGVVSKKLIGERNMDVAIIWCSFRDACGRLDET